MASNNNRTLADVRSEIESEREQLAGAAETLREEISDATNVGAKLRSNLPAVAVGALGVGLPAGGRRRRNLSPDLPARAGGRDEGKARPLPRCRPRLIESATAGRAPSSPEKLSLADWQAAFKRSFASFKKDDCTGLAQQIAYSSLLAFFPAMAFLVGALGLFNLFDDLKQPARPDRAQRRDRLHQRPAARLAGRNVRGWRS